MRSRLIHTAAAFFLASSIAGCASFPSGNPDKVLEPTAALRFSDVPVPAGFKLIPEQSYSFENAGVRVALMKYKGRGTLDQVLNFYKEHMPLARWTLLNISEYGQRLLNFERENETCIITMESKFTGTLITVSLGPKAAASRSRKYADEPLK
ncbi:MAG TPA: hypothetical protein PLG17_12295 [Thermodesulfobacteriota bacterium]|nr:hypothetical protein [Thermodesulfobacteriota bacterium]